MAPLSWILKRITTKFRSPLNLSLVSQHVRTSATVANGRIQDSAVQRDLFVNVLNARVTKRDAKEFIASFRPSRRASDDNAQTELFPSQQEHNARPQSRYDSSKRRDLRHEHLHLALVCFRSAETVDNDTLDGFAVTLSHLVKLGMSIIIALDSNVSDRISGGRPRDDLQDFRAGFTKQADRFCQAIQRRNPEGARTVSSAFEWVQPGHERDQSLSFNPVAVAFPDQLLNPLKRGSILVVPPIAYTAFGQPLPASSKDVMAALTREFSPDKVSAPVSSSGSEVDRVIIIDPIGGIPSKTRESGAHSVFNLEQHFSSFGQSSSEDESASKLNPLRPAEINVRNQHWHNLDMIRECLALLPPASSGLILTPAAAANSSLANPCGEITSGKEIAQKNLLIHNLLTNRPVVSPSLPTGRIPSPVTGTEHVSKAALRTATLVKRGLPLRIIPAEASGWQMPTNGTTQMTLEDDPRVDFGRLVRLINDSFRRRLDVPDYLARTRNRIAGIIVAGDYEGCALFTWEMPPNTQDPARLVPYLDKFAVLQSSQGANGVADVLFQAMVETCFPGSVCWRSRKDNPVNKWYFERSAGSWRIPDSDWTMFWAGERTMAKDRWRDYVSVCSSVRPSWMDSKSQA